MILLYYSKNYTSTGQRLQQIITAAVPEEPTEVYSSVESLSRRNLHLNCDLKILVLLAVDRKELSEILSARDLFYNCRIILILPDQKKETVSEGLRLCPRYFTYLDSTFEDVGAVLDKMITYLKSNNFNYSIEN